MNQEQEDFATKLVLIEREANFAAEDLPTSVMKDRILHIAVVAKLLKARLDVAAGTILPVRKSRGGSKG